MKLKDVFVKFSSGDEIKFLSLEAIIFGSHPLDENGKKMCRFDDLYLFIKESKQYVKMVSGEKYWEMYKLTVDCS